ncbi:DUF6290 family protein [Bacteroides pyogenes]|uniref:MobC family plasmid mobilization relaxosome protein n=1 Tax=Bacteroides pyogenes TaxID=310300 RepID=A0A5D3EB20_9BACE|nr:DUF6290 family protein [Bacteroides pyogenes]TYK32816.1 MobC family plasmid mobilization relaxosome protein [Bacteroides pyogenes]
MKKRNKTSVIIFRVSEEEKRILQKKAEIYNLSLSSYVRKVSLETKILSKTDVKIAFELKKIGVNLNQIAKHLNSIPFEENIKNHLNEIEALLDFIKNILSKIL